MDEYVLTCVSSRCVQRLWCADSGAVGYYEGNGVQSDVPLFYTWLKNTTVRGNLTLAAPSEGTSRSPRSSSVYGHGSVVVLGSTLYFYSSDSRADGAATAAGLPRLSSLLFDAYQPGRAAEDMVHWKLSAYSVLGIDAPRSWLGNWSPLYPSGSDTVTLSVEDYGADEWAIDAVIRVSGGTAWRGALVHSHADSVPSVRSATREVVTVPGYTCRLYASSPGQCARISDGRYSWSQEARALGLSFAPLSPAFNLSVSLWAQTDCSSTDPKRPFRALVGSGFSPLVGIRSGAIYTVVQERDTQCSPARALVLKAFSIPVDLQRGTTVRRLGCIDKLAIPEATDFEASYAATAVKWAGPWADCFTVFVAGSLTAHEYTGAEVCL